MYPAGQEPKKIIEIFSESFRLYGKCFSQLVGIGFILFGIKTLLSIIFLDQYVSTNFKYPYHLFPLIVMSFVIGCLEIFSAAMVFRINDVVNNRNRSLYGLVLSVFKRSHSIIIASTIHGLVLTVAFLTIAFPILGIFTIPLVTSLFFYLYYVVIENLGAFRSLIGSYYLVKGCWWRTTFVLLTPFLSSGVFLGVIVGVLMKTVVPDLNKTIGFNSSISIFTCTVIIPYFYVLGYLQFFDLKLRNRLV
jgi:hypothetical protein